MRSHYGYHHSFCLLLWSPAELKFPKLLTRKQLTKLSVFGHAARGAHLVSVLCHLIVQIPHGTHELRETVSKTEKLLRGFDLDKSKVEVQVS